jgi:exodeoxyribonuclease VII small subunit
MSTTPEKEASFDNLLRSLESEVEKLERGELSLEEALASFEQGITIAKRAGVILDGAEAKVEQLLSERDARSE